MNAGGTMAFFDIHFRSIVPNANLADTFTMDSGFFDPRTSAF